MFKIEKTIEYGKAMRTVQLPQKIHEKMTQIAAEHGVSLESLVLQSCQYALENFRHSKEN